MPSLGWIALGWIALGVLVGLVLGMAESLGGRREVSGILRKRRRP